MTQQKLHQTINALEAVIVSLKRELQREPAPQHRGPSSQRRDSYRVVGEPINGKNDGEHACVECGSTDLQHWQELCYPCWDNRRNGGR